MNINDEIEIKEEKQHLSEKIGNTQVNGITEGVIWKQLLIFFFPLLFGTFFQQLYNTADAVIVGKFVGKVALSAVGGTTGTLINLFVGFFIGLSSGAGVAIAQFYGGKKDAQVSKTVHTAIALAFAGGIIIMAIGLLGAPAALKAMRTPRDIMPYALLYIRIYFCGMIPNLIYNMGASILRSIGDSKRPLYYLIISCLLNIGLDLFFVINLKLGVEGAAIATVIAQIVSAVLVIRQLMKARESYHLNISHIKLERKFLLRILQIGLPAGFQSLMYTSSNVILQSYINRFGTDTIAAWTAYSKIDGIFWMTMSAFGIAITTFVGQNYGAGYYKRVRKGVAVCLGMVMSTALLLSLLLYVFGVNVFYLFTDDRTVIQIGVYIMRFLVPTYLTYVFIEILSGALRGMGNSLIPMLLTFFGVCVFRVVWVTLATPIWPEIRTVIVSYPLTWVATSMLFILYYPYYLKRHKIA